MILSHKKIEAKLKNNDIGINYAFNENFELLDNPKSIINCDETCFESKFKSIRMGVTLGPLVKTHNNSFLEFRKKFKKYKNVFDLRSMKNQIIIKPNETISVLSNENIKLSGNTAALILPRLTLADIGLTLVPTYIDPFWDGILQMTIVNNTSNYQVLRVGEIIGQCFFIEVEGNIDDKFKDLFPQTSHHFGQTWKKIIAEDTNPFPTRKSKFENIGFFKKYFETIKKIVLGLGFMTIIGFIGESYLKVRQAIDHSEQIDKNKNKIYEIESKQSLYFIGNLEMAIPKEKNIIEKTIDLKNKKLANGIVIAKFSNSQENKRIDAYISEVGPEIVRLKIVITLDKMLSKNEKVKVEWVVIK